MNPAGFLVPLGAYAVITVLHLVIPARHVEGYATDTQGRPLHYRLNGRLVFPATIGLWALACWAGLLPWDLWWTVRWESLTSACLLGLLFTAAVVLPAPPTGKGLLADLFLGRPENPQWLGGRVDAKMWLYLVGATQLGLNLYGFAAHHGLTFADPSPGVALHVALFSFFLCEYLFFERVHLYTYDLFAERVGFKLGWGCLVFYPYFYAIALWNTAILPSPHTPWPVLVLAAVVFFGGWSLARGANLQKYTFKRDPTASFLGIAPEVLTDGDRSLLVSGFWGLSRHINYLGEVGMAVGLTLALGYPTVWQTWLYPLYYVLLLVPRQFDDDRRCAAKYGPLWEQYVERVPYRIIPGVF
ncbi:MAG: ergosterol biosynthesis protein [Myxococcota bacterium]